MRGCGGKGTEVNVEKRRFGRKGEMEAHWTRDKSSKWNERARTTHKLEREGATVRMRALQGGKRTWGERNATTLTYLPFATTKETTTTAAAGTTTRCQSNFKEEQRRAGDEEECKKEAKE